jgi:hypothetical protein
MSKHQKHKKHKKHGSPQPDDREMYPCDVCKKRFPFEGYLPSPLSTPFMFAVVADPKHRRFSLAVCMAGMQKFEGEVGLWFVCSSRECIFKSFLMWREWDKRMQMGAFALEQIGALPKGDSASPMGDELDNVLRNSAIQRAREAAQSHEESDEAAVPAEALLES